MTLQKPKIAKEIIDSRVDFYNSSHNDLSLRLREDFSNVHNKINNASLIEQKGQDITINHSYAGYTEGLKVEGCTLQNLIDKSTTRTVGSSSPQLEQLLTGVKSTMSSSGSLLIDFKSNIMKPNTDYTIICNVATTIEQVIAIYGTNMNESSYQIGSFVNKNGLNIVNIRTGAELGGWLRIGNNGNITTVTTLTLENIMLLEGTISNIPNFFEGIQSCGEKENNKISILSNNGGDIFNCTLENGGISGDGIENNWANFIKTKEYVNVNTNENLYIKIDTISTINIYTVLFDKNKNFIKRVIYNSMSETKFNTENASFIKITINSSNNFTINDVKKIWLCKGTLFVKDTYKTYKKDILLSEPLRRIREVKDSVEKINNQINHIKKISQLNLTSEENITIGKDLLPESQFIQFLVNTNITFNSKNNSICNNFNYKFVNEDGTEHFYVSNQRICFIISKSKLTEQTVQGFKNWLKANKTSIIYELLEPIITPLDIDNIELQTFDTTTYATSENAIKPTLTFKAPVNVPATIKNLQEENKQLKEEIEVVNNKNLELNTEILGVQDFALDVDFRACITELDIVDIKKHIGLK